MKKRDIVYFKHIKDSISRINEFTKDISFEEFSANVLIQSAVIRQIEVIGEAAKNISEETKGIYKNIEWKKISGMRDVLIHEYFRVDLNEVYKTIKTDIPTLKSKIDDIIRNGIK